MLELNKVYCGDCLELMKDIPDGSIDCVITDPPYGMNKDFANDTPAEADVVVKSAITECRRIARRNILSFWSAQRLDLMRDVFGSYKRVLIWNKQFALYAPNKVGYRYEPIVWVGGDSANSNRGDIYNCMVMAFKAQRGNFNHPTQKPVDLLIDLILDFTNPGDTILDPFLGSGTTAVAALKTGRNFIGIEIDPKYCEIAQKRVDAELAQTRLDL